MPTIQDLEFADLRVVRDDDGKITSIIDTAGRDVGLVSAKTDPVTGGIVKTIWNGTQAQYDAISVKDADTLYIIVAG